MNDDNLIPNNRRTAEELREMGRKGGIKSGEARRKKRDLLKAMKMWSDAIDELSPEELKRLSKILSAYCKSKE